MTSKTTVQVQIERAARAIATALDTGVPILKLAQDSEPITLAYRRAGETIDDPDCEHEFTALASGVYRRFRMTGASGDGWCWLYYCPLSRDHLADFLRQSIEQLPWLDAEAIPMDAVWQLHQWCESRRRAARRAAAARPGRPA